MDWTNENSNSNNGWIEGLVLDLARHRTLDERTIVRYSKVAVPVDSPFFVARFRIERHHCCYCGEETRSSVFIKEARPCADWESEMSRCWAILPSGYWTPAGAWYSEFYGGELVPVVRLGVPGADASGVLCRLWYSTGTDIRYRIKIMETARDATVGGVLWPRLHERNGLLYGVLASIRYSRAFMVVLDGVSSGTVPEPVDVGGEHYACYLENKVKTE